MKARLYKGTTVYTGQIPLVSTSSPLAGPLRVSTYHGDLDWKYCYSPYRRYNVYATTRGYNYSYYSYSITKVGPYSERFYVPHYSYWT